MTLEGYPVPTGVAPAVNVGFWWAKPDVPKECKAMTKEFMNFHRTKTQNPAVPFLKHVMMPEFRLPHCTSPVALFAHLSAKGGPEDPKVLNNFLTIAMQRANIFGTTFKSITDIHKRGAVLSFFCSAAPNTMPYTMDSIKKNMSEWFGSPRNRGTG